MWLKKGHISIKIRIRKSLNFIGDEMSHLWHKLVFHRRNDLDRWRCDQRMQSGPRCGGPIHSSLSVSGQAQWPRQPRSMRPCPLISSATPLEHTKLSSGCAFSPPVEAALSNCTNMATASISASKAAVSVQHSLGSSTSKTEQRRCSSSLRTLPLSAGQASEFGASGSLSSRNELASTVSAVRSATPKQGGVFKIMALAQKAEYIWMDGQEGQKGIRFNEMRSKTKVIPEPIKAGSVDFPKWSFDGSSTGQAEGRFSDCILNPVFSCPDPIRGDNHVLVLCEVLNPDSTPHETNTRRKIEELLTPDVLAEETLFGFEQEYTMFNKAGKVYGWPEGGFPHPQGPFYCGVGLEAVYGRPLVEAHLDACIKAGLKISGINAEVMPGQWEFQIGPAGPLEVGDHVMISRWLLHRLGEDFGITCTFEPKPMEGDWNGAGAHTNYSTKSMRVDGGIKAIHAAIEKLSKKHAEHIASYGLGNERRLTGKHETANINTFKSGVADRGASIRIPLGVSLEGKGYLEDRRPAANVDPYVVSRMLIQTTLKN